MNILQSTIPLPHNKSSAKMIILTDYISQADQREGGPLLGLEESQFNRIISSIRLTRAELYITSVIKTPIRKDDIGKIYSSKGYRHTDWYILREQILDEISQCDSKIVVVMGEIASAMIFDEPRYADINKQRGSIYRASNFESLSKIKDKIICITHPIRDSMMFGDPTLFYILINDISKFYNLIEDDSPLDIIPIIHKNLSHNEVIQYLMRVNNQEHTSYDIESTPHHITCFSFSLSKYEAISIQLMDNSGNVWTVDEEIQIWDMVAKILGDHEIKKIAQNGMFDFMFTLRTMNIKTDNFWFDTMIAQHIAWTDLPKGLDFLTSVYTHFPYYKDEGKQSHLKLIKDWDMYWEYNGKDAVNTNIIVEPLTKELEKINAMKDMDYMMSLHKPLMEMEFNGIYADKQSIYDYKIRLERHISVLKKALNRIAGKELNHASSKQMIAYFYGDLMIKPYVNKKTGNASADTLAMTRIAKKGGKGVREAKIILRLRKLSKLASTYFDVRLDGDSKLRCAHKICGTSTGRISTAATFFGTGTNLQNQTPIFRKYLHADPGYILIERDLAKAEAHIVAYLCQDVNMIKAFENKVDIHTFNASMIFNVPMDQVTKWQRQMGKKIVHASNYKMGPGTFSDSLAKEDYFIGMGECKQLLQAYANRFPALGRWHREVENQVKTTRLVHNLFGRPKRFLGSMDDNLIRSAIAYNPQSTVAEILNRGLIKISNDAWFKDKIQLLLTVHDSVLVQTKIEDCNNVEKILSIAQRMDDHLTHSFTYRGKSFAVGVDMKIGTCWGKLYEIKTQSLEDISIALNKLNIKN